MSDRHKTSTSANSDCNNTFNSKIYYLCFVHYDEGLIPRHFWFLFHFPLLFYLDCFLLVAVHKKSSLVTGIFQHLLEAFIAVSFSSPLLLLFSNETLPFWFSIGSPPSPTPFFASPKLEISCWLVSFYIPLMYV